MAEPTGSADTNRPSSVANANAQLRTAVENRMRGETVRVRGIAWDITHSQRGHTYFRLREGRYALSCAVLFHLARVLPFRIENGQELTVEGHVELAGWSELRIVAHDVTLEQSAPTRETLSVLKARAQDQGWLDARRKRRLPRPPEAIGLITGGSSRAFRDVTGSLRDAGVESQVIPQFVLLSGPDVAIQVRAAMGSLNDRPEVDLIVIARGGTRSGPDFVAFNDWALAETIVRSRAPVLTAIGHRQDQTLADMVADGSVPTPSLVGLALTGAQARVGFRELGVLGVVLAFLVILLVVLGRTLGWL
jgi:exodeoxyribonuclease VII large subunit